MNADDVFSEMAQKYARCKTYSDSGLVEGGLGVVTFKTFFIRPKLFKFEFSMRAPGWKNSATIWSNGNSVFDYYDIRGKAEERPSLAAALAFSKSASQLASYVVPTLLLPEHAGNGVSLAKLLPYKFLEHKTIAERSCHRLGSTNDEESLKAELLIDKLGLKLRGIELEFREQMSVMGVIEKVPDDLQFDQEELLDFSTVESEVRVAKTTFADVSFDKEIDDAIFNFSP